MLTTDDLFLGGLALSRGAQLVGVDVQDMNGRRVAVFRIAGPAAEQAEEDYYGAGGGTTSVNVQLLKLQVRRLKERAFATLREESRHADPGRDRRVGPCQAADAEPHRSRRR